MTDVTTTTETETKFTDDGMTTVETKTVEVPPEAMHPASHVDCPECQAVQDELETLRGRLADLETAAVPVAAAPAVTTIEPSPDLKKDEKKDDPKPDAAPPARRRPGWGA